MIHASDELASAVEDGSFTSGYVADLIVDGQVMLKDFELAGELVADGGSLVLTQGKLTLTYSDDLGQSVVPTQLTSWLTPFVSFLDVSYRVSNKLFSEKVLRGRLKIVGVTDPQERKIRFQDRLITVGSSVKLKVADLFHVTDMERFEAPSAPGDLSSAWAELGRLTLLPLSRSVADVAIPRSVTYVDNRLDAVVLLADLLGGIPYVTPAGEVSIAPTAWGSVVATLGMGPNGRVSKAGADDLTDTGIANKVIVRSWDDQQATILATAQVVSGPLRWGGKFGRVPYFLSSEFVTTASQAQAWADRMLPVVSSMNAVLYTVQCLPDPRLEVWDVIKFEKDGVFNTGQILKMTLPARGMMTLVVSVPLV
ncbi:hypothetical protein E3O55_08515 [Cryobacterium sp. MDB1-18-2]|uniref:hypothetical protein n=1 Tax=unclassified Cryobacterium TaxID=2649013 RepID=UPI001068F589|nr:MULTISPECIES: hypothetical protein [unclassified Cryobacterium]TFC30116.1 hypothetical protein E3O55_08515 [Cryobacterium sp. MDB1-18-2]TFC41396.1 hypothetical protein E3O50_09955 [Cryobacterium sp. MDB1-18-1]